MLKIHALPVLFALLMAAGPGHAQGTVKAPVLINRKAIISERDRLSERLVAKHDTVTVHVYIFVDSLGYVHRPEVKEAVKDPRLKKAAIALVTNMRFAPARNPNGRPQPVLLTVPVRFARAIRK